MSGIIRNGNTGILDASGNGAFGVGDLVYTIGKPGDAYVSGDWDADLKTEIGAVRNNNTWCPMLPVTGNMVLGISRIYSEKPVTSTLPGNGCE